MVRAFLLSFLARQYLLLQARFSERYPHCWLAWEPGAWSVPATSGDLATTRHPTAEPGVPPPPLGDALCFELSPRRLRLGRAAENEIVINDATVSREHLALVPGAAGAWSLVATARATELGGAPVAEGEPHPLASGATIKAGSVLLTFLDAPGFLARVAQVAQKLKD